MSKLTVEFAFEIGDEVYARGTTHNSGNRPVVFIVCERWAQQCPGGIQLHYKLGGLAGNILEMLLTHDEPPYKDKSDAEYAALERQIMASDAARTKAWAIDKPKEPDPPSEQLGCQV